MLREIIVLSSGSNPIARARQGPANHGMDVPVGAEVERHRRFLASGCWIHHQGFFRGGRRLPQCGCFLLTSTLGGSDGALEKLPRLGLMAGVSLAFRLHVKQNVLTPIHAR